jgi:5-dehydro-4-deoxyglucarate dehydratase
MFNGMLFFPITPYARDGEVDLKELAAHIERGAGAGGVVACGTGEFSALEPDEYAEVVRTAVETIAGRVPVFAGAGGPVRTARRFADRAAAAGADGVLLLPPYLTEATGRGLEAYVRAATREDLPAIVYNRANARFTGQSAVAVAELPQVIGFKDGVGDLLPRCCLSTGRSWHASSPPGWRRCPIRSGRRADAETAPRPQETV